MRAYIGLIFPQSTSSHTLQDESSIAGSKQSHSSQIYVNLIKHFLKLPKQLLNELAIF